MHVAHLALTDFRSYRQVDLDLGPGVTAFIGPNGQGKTNLVEAIGYLATGTSHRVATDAPLVRAGAERAVVRASVVREGRPVLLEVEITPGRANRARLNRTPLPRPRDLLGTLHSVLFAPEDLSLVKGEPEGRRRFLDDLLVQLAPRYAGVRTDYDKVLRQRNALLRRLAPRGYRPTGPDLATLEVFDAHLAAAGAELLAARLFLVRRLAPYVATSYEQVSGGQGDAVLGYRSSLPQDVGALVDSTAPLPSRSELGSAMLEAMQAMRGREVDRGQSLIGPHRDDLVLNLGPLPAKGYASHGESWSLALALRLGSYELLRTEEAGDGDPVLVLDDVFAELDEGRRSRLAALVAAAEQVLLTAAVVEDVPIGLAGDRVQVRAGEVLRG